jgi:hypothetical protein
VVFGTKAISSDSAPSKQAAWFLNCEALADQAGQWKSPSMDASIA